MRWLVTKTNNGRNFQFKKFSAIDYFLADRGNLFEHPARIGLWQVFQSSIVALNRENFRVFSVLCFFPF